MSVVLSVRLHRFDRRNVERIPEVVEVMPVQKVPVVQQTTSTFETRTHNPYDSDSLSSDDSEYEAQLIRRAERNRRREQEEQERVAAEEVAAAAAAATAQEEAYPHEPDADRVQQVAGMFAAEQERGESRQADQTDTAGIADAHGQVDVEGADSQQALDAEKQRDGTTSELLQASTDVGDAKEGKYLHEMEAEASAAMRQMQDELDALEQRKIDREHNLADGRQWVDPSMDGRKLDVEQESAKQRDSEVRVQAVAEFAPLQMGDLGFSAGEILVVTDMSTPWWIGYRDGQPEQKGTFPSNYVKHYNSGKTSRGKAADGWKDTMMIELPSSVAGP